MLNRSIIIVIAIISGVVLSSCSSKFSLTKRRYTKGYHLDVAGNKSKTKERPATSGTSILGNPNPEQLSVYSPTVTGSRHNENTGNKAVVNSDNKEIAVPVKHKHHKTKPSDVADLEASLALQAFNPHEKERAVQGLSAAKTSDEEAQVPYEFFGNGTGILAYIAGFFLSMLLLFLFWLVVFALLAGSPWLIGLLIGVLVIALIIIIIAVVLNGD